MIQLLAQTRNPSLQASLAIAALGAAVFIPFLGAVHLFDWDEINFAESAREMLVTGNYAQVQVNFQPFWEKPPLFIWLQALSMHLFGVNEFAARLPNALCGILTLVLLFRIGTGLYNQTVGFTWTLAYIGSFLPHFYFKTGIIDPVFNLFIFLGVYFLFLALNFPNDDMSSRLWRVATAGAFIGLGILTKGPVALLVSGLCGAIYVGIKFFQTKRLIATVRDALIFLLSAATVSSAWFGIETAKNGFWFLREFILYQIGLFSQPIAGHGQPFYYHFFVLLFGVFPASFIALGAFGKRSSQTETQANFKLLMTILFGVVLTIFSISTTKIAHYSSLCYFPLTFLAAHDVHKVLSGEKAWTPVATILCALFGATVALLVMLFPIALYHVDVILPWIKDDLTKAVLQTPVPWSGFEWLIGALYFILILLASMFLFKKNFAVGFGMLFASTALTTHFFTLFVAPKVERYTQGAPIDFYEQRQGEDCYIITGYKSYAHYFYARMKPPSNPNANNEAWLLSGEIDKPTYFVAKLPDRAWYEEKPNLSLIKVDGGFVFFKRDVPPSHDSTRVGGR